MLAAVWLLWQGSPQPLASPNVRHWHICIALKRSEQFVEHALPLLCQRIPYLTHHLQPPITAGCAVVELQEGEGRKARRVAAAGGEAVARA